MVGQFFKLNTVAFNQAIQHVKELTINDMVCLFTDSFAM